MSSNKFRAASFLVSLAVIFGGLTAGWVSAAHASEPGDLVHCTERPLIQGKAGETVRECRVIKPTTRTGHTVIIARLGSRGDS